MYPEDEIEMPHSEKKPSKLYESKMIEDSFAPKLNPSEFIP